MNKIGVCEKCGETKNVRNHHIKGYGEENKDYVVKYCNICDQKAHQKAREEGRCNLSHEEVCKLSQNSYARRTHQTINISCDTLMPYVYLRELIVYNINTGKPTCETIFQANGGRKLLYIGE